MIETEGIYHSNKILTQDEAIEKVRKIQSNGKKVALCVGGYDLIHPGHMTHLISGKSSCDSLIVAITADKFNSKRKGEGRPVYSEKLRAFSISQLEPVDFVFISDYKTGVEVINLLKPDFYVKGPDYKDKQTPGITAEREAIKGVGGEIHYTSDEKLSTSGIINYIKDNIK